MPIALRLFFVTAVLFRVATLIVSVRHEKRLKQAGATEYGATNSIVLALFHVAFYIAAYIEGSIRGPRLDLVAFLGIALYLFSAVSLLLVIHLLGPFWTVKLLLARDHVLVSHPLFRTVKHPNYYLNILPELVGLALALHAFLTLVLGLLLYLIPLIIRIREEEKVMKQTFKAYP